MSDPRDPRITALIVELAGSSPEAPTYQELEELRDTPAPTLSPQAERGPRGWVIAVSTALGALVVVGGVILLLSSAPSPAPVQTVTTTMAPSLPDIDTWTWQRIDGDADSVPAISSVVSVDGGLLAFENECRPDRSGTPAIVDCQTRAWSSPDGLTWTRQPLPPAFREASGHVFEVGGQTWASVSTSAQSDMYRLSGDQWEAIDLPVGPNGETPQPVGWPLPAGNGDDILVTGHYGETLVAWVSSDAGESFQASALPVADWAPDALIAGPAGFAIYGGPAELWGRADVVEALVSADGAAWSMGEETPFSRPATDESQSGYRISGSGPYFAFVWTEVVSGGRPADPFPEWYSFGEYWVSEDGIAWTELPALAAASAEADPATHTVLGSDFGIVAIAFLSYEAPTEMETDFVQVLLSADGFEWADVSDPDILYPNEPPGNVGGGMAHLVVGDLVIVRRSYENGERTLWVGSFQS